MADMTSSSASPPRSPSASGMCPILHGTGAGAKIDPIHLKGAPLQVKRVVVVHNDRHVLGIETEWSNGASKRHGDFQKEGAQRVECELEDGEVIQKVGIKCRDAERNSHLSAITIHTNKRGMRTKWLGGTEGEARFLEKEGHHVIGFVGRASQCIDALGIVTVCNASKANDFVRGPVFGGPSGIPFTDVVLRDCSQLSNFVLRAAFKQEASSYFLESARQVFHQMQELCPTQMHEETLLSEAEAYFGATFRERSPDTVVSPLLSRCRTEYEGRKSADALKPFPLTFNPFAHEFAVADRGLTASCQVSAGWRTLLSSTPLPVEALKAGGAVQVDLAITEEVRIVAVGIADTDPTPFVGGDSQSFGYQSTGHLMHEGDMQAKEGSAFGPGVTVRLLVTRDSVHFYRDSSLVGSLPCKPEQHPYLAVSCYLGPNTFTILGCRVWDAELCKATPFPPPQME